MQEKHEITPCKAKKWTICRIILRLNRQLGALEYHFTGIGKMIKPNQPVTAVT